MSLKKTNGWTDLMAKSGVKVKYKYTECHDKTNDIHRENVLLKFQNTRKQAVDVSWKHLQWYDGNCSECGKEDPEFKKEIRLEKGEVVEGDCDRGTAQYLKVFSRFLQTGKGRPNTKLTGIRLANMKVE